MCFEEVLGYQIVFIEFLSILMFYYYKYVGSYRLEYNLKKDLYVLLFFLDLGMGGGVLKKQGRGVLMYLLINFLLFVCFNYFFLMMNLK